MSVKTLLLLLGLASVSVLAQDSSQSDILTIQTSPPEPISSTSSVVSVSNSVSSSQSASGSDSASGTTSAPSATSTSTSSSSSSSSFPGNCADQCRDISTALASCGAGDALNTTCLCTPIIEANYVSCLQCGLSLTPTENERQVYQGILDAYINQCASAPLSPISLPNMTITLPSSSPSGSGSSSSGSNSVSITSSSISASSSAGSSSSVSDTNIYPSSSISRGPIPVTSTITASASNRPSAGATSGNSGSSKRINNNNNGLMSIGLAGVVGVVIAAAAI